MKDRREVRDETKAGTTKWELAKDGFGEVDGESAVCINRSLAMGEDHGVCEEEGPNGEILL